MNDMPAHTTLGESSPTHNNPPGLSVVSFRTGTYATILPRLIRRLITQHGEHNDLPIVQLDTQRQANWIVSLLESWAMVVDVLNFYQERITNEGYLRTATESRSIRELTSAIGYEPRPGISASTYLAFIVRVGKAEPPRRCLLPQGLVVQSVPTQGQRVVSLPEANTPPNQAQLPQIFETSTAFEAFSEWNTIQPLVETTRPDRTLAAGSTSLLLAGIKTGIRVGDGLLIVSADPPADGQARQWIFAHVETVEPNQQRGFTRITWSMLPGSQQQQQTTLHNPAVYTFRQQAKLYPYTPGPIYATRKESADWSPVSIGLPGSAIHTLLMGNDGTLFVGTDNGIFRSSNNGERWDAINTGLMKMQIHALTMNEKGQLFAGSHTGNLFVSADNGTTWQMVVARSTTRRGLLALLPLPRSAPQTLPRGVIRALASYQEQNHSYLAAATVRGVFVSEDAGTSWRQPPDDKSTQATPRVAAWVFAAPGNEQKPLVGMDTGVFPIARPDWRSWFIPLAGPVAILCLLLFLIGALAQLASPTPSVARIIFQYGFFEQLSFMLRQLPIPFSVIMGLASFFQPAILLLLLLLALILAAARVIAMRSTQRPQSAHALPLAPVKALAFGSHGTLFAASASGLFRSSDQGLNWTQLPGAPAGTITVITAGTNEELFLGTQEGSVYRSQNNGDSWEDFSHNLHLGAIAALAIHTGALFAAGDVDRTDESGQWTRSQLAEKQLNLDKVYTGILPSSWTVLVQGNRAACYMIASLTTSATQDYKKSTPVTSLYVDSEAALASFSRLTTRVYVESHELALFDDTPIQGQSIRFDRFVPDLYAGQRLIVSGKRMRVRLHEAATLSAALLSLNGLQQQPVRSESTFEALAAPVQESGETRWLLRDRAGFVGTLSAAAGSVTYELANDNDEVVSEVVVIQTVSTDSQNSVTFAAPLQHVYDRSTVIVYGNVVEATHGQTVQNEVLGSVSEQNTYHRFQLKQQPLSYLSAADAEANVPTHLSIQVNQVPWHQVPAFYDLSTGERGYMLRQDDQQQTQIIFGNGSAGAPPPTGQEHITASYRFGSGSRGNVPANSLTLLRTRPPAIQSVTNPVPASGGADPEEADMARVNAPRHIQTMQRIVSLTDYERFTRTFPGIGKVTVNKLWHGRAHLLVITVAGENESGSTIPTEALQAAITAAVAPPAPAISIQPYEAVYFHLQARLIIAANDAPRAREILADVQHALLYAFGFSQRQLGQGVSAAELVQVMQQVDGIVAVELEQLHIRGQAASFNPVLAAASGRIEAGVPRPAQLLLIDADDDYEHAFQVEIH